MIFVVVQWHAASESGDRLRRLQRAPTGVYPRVSALRGFGRLWRLESRAQEGPVEATDAAGLRAELPEFLGLRVLADGSAVVLAGGKAGEGEQRVGDVAGPFVRQVTAMVSATGPAGVAVPYDGRPAVTTRKALAALPRGGSLRSWEHERTPGWPAPLPSPDRSR